ncbi:MAG: S1 RNA-binding domain-containing protein [Phycisphaerales bacterium]|nr:S1 RNA-binding domain-containing protein [Phycisphaerales bacterium]
MTDQPQTTPNDPATPSTEAPSTTASTPMTPPASSSAELDAQTNAEIEAAMADLADAGAAEEGASNGKIRGPRVVRGGREHRTGKVVSVGATDLFVEFGPKELGVIDVTQFKEEKPKVGDALEVAVQRFDSAESLYICALPGAVQKADWEMLEQGQVVEARVTGTNKGGLELEIAGHRAFMPASQVDINHIADLSVYVGEKITCEVQKIDRRGQGNIVLSRRDIIAKERAKAAEGLKEALNEGDTIEGTVRKIMDFGAFVDIGGVDGLIHINDLSHDRVNHGAKGVAQHVSEGQKVTVQILKIDWEANRIGLGLKQLQADPFTAAASEVVEGAEMTGKVTKILDFGAFIEVAPGIEGLVHISELEWRRVNDVNEVLTENEVVQVKVLKVDSDDRKISLSIKQLKDRPQQQGGGGRGRGGKGGGRGRDDRDPAEILKETPQLRRLREQSKKSKPKGGGGIGNAGGLGIGLGDLKL